MGKWFIVRHGQTEWNATGRVQGHTDIGLSERGRQQACAMARRLAQVPIDVAYTATRVSAGSLYNWRTFSRSSRDRVSSDRCPKSLVMTSQDFGHVEFGWG